MQKPDELVAIYSTDSASEAEVLRVALEGEGIRCDVSGEGQAGLAGISIMKIELYVRAIDADRARKFLEAHHHGQ